MAIACIGWGSLVWDHRDLPINSKWFLDGPYLPIEFSRQSEDGRLTLVITTSAQKVQTLWATMNVDSVEEGIRSLAKREGIGLNNMNRLIGSVRPDQITTDPNAAIIKEWVSSNELDAAIWTNLSPKFQNIDRCLSVDEAVDYLRGLDAITNSKAEEYVKRAPKQIGTMFRTRFETEFGWC